jgi:Leucine-rich repeat (LRR) protein
MISDTFDSTPNIERLVLSKNRLKHLPHSVSSLRKLKMLDLSRNPQLHVEHIVNKLRSVTNLRWLNLSEVPLKTLESLRHIIHYTNDREHNETAVQLSGIDLSGCDLTITSGDVAFFDFMSSLHHINLSHNHLSTMPHNIFRSLQNLQTLNLASNILINGFRLQIGEKHSLKLLDLSNNKLSNLESINLSGTVDEINLSENAVLEWNKRDLFLKAYDHNRTWVKRVNLTRNAITTITENMGSSLVHLESVDLGENPFDCESCEMPTFQRWLRQHKSTKVFNLGTTNNLICGGTRRARTEIMSVPFNNTSCLPLVEDAIFDPVVVIGLPLLVVAALVLLSVIAVYGYRFEIAYVRHLVNIRRQRHIRDNESIAHYKYDVFVSYW